MVTTVSSQESEREKIKTHTNTNKKSHVLVGIVSARHIEIFGLAVSNEDRLLKRNAFFYGP